VQNSNFIDELKKTIQGDVLSDAYSLGMYATDASLYQIDPVVIVLPKHDADVKEAVLIAVTHRVSILPRGGGTSLAGQTVGNSMVLDFSKYMNQILEFNKEEQWVRVQPGIARDDLNLFLLEHGLIYAPDPATSSRANLGGMIGNNSSGTKSILYGKTIDHLIGLKVLLSDGTEMQLNERSQQEYDAVCQGTDRQADIYKTYRKYIYDHSDEIKERFPKTMRRVGGYPLDEFVYTDKWNLSKLFCGSEGTLGLSLEATVKLVKLPKEKLVCVVHFSERLDAIRAVSTMVKYSPSCIEILDDTVIGMSRENLTTKRHTHWIDGDPISVQIVEFFGDTKADVLNRAESMVAELKAEGFGYAFPIFSDTQTMNDVWMIRKKGLGLILGRQDERKAIAFIEDAAIPIDVLADYISEVQAVCDKYQTEAAVYAHASVGVIHVRPFLNMKEQEDIDRFKDIANETFQLVKKYKGSWSGEHGDGLVRSPFNQEFFGDRVYQLFKDVKQLLDPHGLMNPGKIVNAPPMDHNLRYGTSYDDKSMETVYHYRADVSFHESVHMCSGVGECRKKSGGTMCPSFKATEDEEHSTRGRANALRLAMSGQLEGGVTDARLLEILDLCLSCKACKSECPSNVDMAKLKSEVWQKKYDRGNICFRDKLINSSAAQSKKFSGFLAPIVNTVQATYPFRAMMEKVAGIEKKHKLPAFASEKLSSWFEKNYTTTNKNEVVLFADTYINYHETNIGKAAVQLLNDCGYKVILADVGCCQRPRISNGWLKNAKKDGTVVAEKLLPYIQKKIPIVICEPSCATSFHLDLPDLIDDESLASALRSGVHMIDVFLWDQQNEGKLKGRFESTKENIHVHGHCHQKAIYGLKAIDLLYGNGTGNHEILDTGCCGMAGSFGYEKEHYELSLKVGEDRLFPALRKMDKDDTVVACGVSCRHQIAHVSDKKPLHWVETVKYVEDINS